MLLASSKEVYDNAFSDMNIFIRSRIVNAMDLQNRTDWWQRRRHNVFRAYSECLQDINHSQVTQLKLFMLLGPAWIKRSHTLCINWVWHKRLTYPEIRTESVHFKRRTSTWERTNLNSLNRKFSEREKEAAIWKGSDFIHFVVSSSTKKETLQQLNIWLWCPKGEKVEIESKFQKWLESANDLKAGVTIRRQSIVNIFKKEFTVANSSCTKKTMKLWSRQIAPAHVLITKKKISHRQFANIYCFW